GRIVNPSYNNLPLFALNARMISPPSFLNYAVKAGLAQRFHHHGPIQVFALDADSFLRAALALEGHLGIFEDSLDRILASAAADVNVFDGHDIGLGWRGLVNRQLHFLAAFRGATEKAAVQQGLDAGFGRGVVLGGEADNLRLDVGLDVGHAIH